LGKAVRDATLVRRVEPEGRTEMLSDTIAPEQHARTDLTVRAETDPVPGRIPTGPVRLVRSVEMG
jgi:hypothetical protein